MLVWWAVVKKIVGEWLKPFEKWMARIKISLYLTDLLTVVPVPNVTRIIFLVSEVKFAGRWTEELPFMQSLSVVFVKGAWCPWYWIRVWRHQKKAKLLLVVRCSGLCWRASWQLALRVCLYRTLQNWPNCSALYLFFGQNAAIQWFITPSYWGGPVFRTWHADLLSWRKVFVFFSQFHEDITGIVPHIWPQLFPCTSLPTYFALFILISYVV